MRRDTAVKSGAACPFTATTRSPGFRPAAAAGVFTLTSATSVLGCCEGAPVAYTTMKMRNATRMFAAGPAAMTATRFHVGWRQYASLPVPSSTSRSARFAERRAAGVSSAASASARSSGIASRAAVSSPASRCRPTRWTAGASPGSSRNAGVMNAWRSRADGRCMPGMRTRPPSGIAPIPYSIPLRLIFTIAGGKPT